MSLPQPNTYQVCSLVYLLGPYFPNETLTEYIPSSTFASWFNSSRFVTEDMRRTYSLAFGNRSSDAVADMVNDRLRHGNRYTITLAILIISMAVSSIMVILRLLAKWKGLGGPSRPGGVRLNFGDWLIFGALVTNFAAGICYVVPSGMRNIYQHMWDVRYSDLIGSFKWGLISSAITQVGHLLMQLSVLEMYGSFSMSLNFWRVKMSVAALCIIGSIVLLPFPWISCAFFIRSSNTAHPSPNGFAKCLSRDLPVKEAISGFYIVTDFIMLFLPTAIVCELNASLFTRLSVLGMFTIGALSWVFSILRIYAITSQKKTKDFSWAFLDFAVYTMLEVYFGMACACLPAIRAFYRSKRSAMSNKGQSSLVSVYKGKSKPTDITPTVGDDAETIAACPDEIKSGVNHDTGASTDLIIAPERRDVERADGADG